VTGLLEVITILNRCQSNFEGTYFRVLNYFYNSLLSPEYSLKLKFYKGILFLSCTNKLWNQLVDIVKTQ